MSDDTNSSVSVPDDLIDLDLTITNSAEAWVRAGQAALQKKLLPILTAVIGLGVIYAWVDTAENLRQPSFWIVVVLLTAGFGLLLWASWLTWRGRARAAAWLAVITLSLIIIAISVAYADMIIVGAMLGLFTTLLMAVLISPKASYVYAVGMTLVGAALITLFATETLDPEPVPEVIRQTVNMLTFTWTLFLGVYLIAQNQTRTHQVLAQLFDKSGTLQTYNEQLQREITERQSAQQALTQKATELTRSNAIISALSRVAARLETTNDPAQVQETLGQELKSLGISCLLGWLDVETEDWTATYLSLTSTTLTLVEKLLGVSVVGSRTPKSIWEKYFLLDPGMTTTVTDPSDLTAELFPFIPKATMRAAVRAAGVTPHTPVFYLPLAVENQTIGVAALWGSDLRHEDKPALTVFAGQIAAAFENARLHQAAQQRLDELNALFQVGTTILSTFDRQTLLPAILREAVHLLNATSAYVSQWDAGQKSATVIAEQFGPAATAAERVSDLGITYTEETLIDQALTTGQPIAIRLADPDLPHDWRSHLEAYGGRSILILPIIAQNKATAYFEVWESRTDRVFSEHEILLGQNLAALTGVALQNARLYGAIRQHSANLEQEVARQTQELTAANERLQELDRLKSKFIDDISHELRTPITTLSLYLDLLVQGKPERRPHYLEVLQAEKGRLVQLVEGIIRLSQLSLLKEEVAVTAVNLNDIAAQVIAAQRQRAEPVGARLMLTAAPDLPAVQGVPGQLTEAVTHLVANAIQYAPGETVTISAEAVTEPKPGVCFRVHDDGDGINPEDLPHVFDRFYRGRGIGQSNIPGSGLGLAIVKTIVALHKGEVTAVSEPGQGTIFQMWLPVGNGEAEPPV